MTSPGKAAAKANKSVPAPPPYARFHPFATPPFKVPPATPVLATATAKANQSVFIPPANAFAVPLKAIPFKVPPANPPLAFKAPPATPPAFIPVPVPPKLRCSWPFHREDVQRFEQRINELGGAPPQYFKAPPPMSVPPRGYRRARLEASIRDRPRPDRRHSV